MEKKLTHTSEKSCLGIGEGLVLTGSPSRGEFPPYPPNHLGYCLFYLLTKQEVSLLIGNEKTRTQTQTGGQEAGG